MMIRFLSLITILAFLAGCTIPVVGNSPQEVKHRKWLENGGQSQ